MSDDSTDQKTQIVQPINEALINRIVAVVEQASTKGVTKRKIVKFLQNQPDITENDIDIGYNRYYEKHV